jgi:hypothetical protein
MWPVWGGLLHSVKTGRSVRGLVSRRDAFQSLGRDSEARRCFDDAMTEISRLVADRVARAGDFSGVRRLVDVGGGRGELLATILDAHPSMRGVLFDLPEALEGVGERLAAAGVADRCEVVPGSFLDSVPSGADAYLLKSVVHDWDDERARAILTNCRQAMAGRGRLLVVERLLPERMSPSPADRFMAASDLGMMVAVAGRERTEAEFRALFAASGFALARIAPAAVHYSVIEGVCA